MTTKVVLLQKVRRNRAGWNYMADREKFSFQSEGTIVDQIIDVVIDIQKNVAPNGEKLFIISHSIISIVDAIAKDLFPEITFMKLSDANLIAAFANAFVVPSYKKSNDQKTLFIGSDASGGHHETISAWAWATESSYSMGVCEFRDVNISEFEGILRAIIENRENAATKFHVYSDSTCAIAYFTAAVLGDEELEFVKGTYFVDLISEVKEILSLKTVKVEWVRSHKTHRLNGAADCLSRHARRSAQGGKSLKTTVVEADAMFTMFSR